MKRTISIILAALALTISLNAQDSRQRLTSTIVGDVLAAMPAQNASEAASDMKDLAASAPESIAILASMLQSADKAANNKVEYAISGVTNYVAGEGKAYKDAVKKGLQQAALTVKDEFNRQFIEQQLRFLSPEAEPAETGQALSTKELEAKVKADMKSGQRNRMCEALYIQAEQLGTFDDKALMKALKSDDRSYRTMALEYAESFADQDLYKSVGKSFSGLGDEAKEDVLNWFGDNKVKQELPVILDVLSDRKAAKKGSGTGLRDAAIEALGKIGGDEAADALIGELGGSSSAAAKKALLSFPGSLTSKVQEAMSESDGAKLDELLSIASAKHMTECSGKVFELAQKGSASALEALAGVVSAKDVSRLTGLVDKADDTPLEYYTKALKAAIAPLSPDEQYAKAKYAIEGANNKGRFYGLLAQSGTDEAVADLTKAYDAGSQDALKALIDIDNYGAAKTLLNAGKSGDKEALSSYVDKVAKYVANPDKRCHAIKEALQATKDTDIEKKALGVLRNTPTAEAFTTAGEYLGNAATAIPAAEAVRAIAAKCIDEIPFEEKLETLDYAMKAFKARGTADDGYAIDDIKKIISETEAPIPVSFLSDEEEAEGYEMLFDGTSLDKWTGNKTNYQIVNNTIYVTAAYGSEGNLYTVKEYKDFVYRFEFCFVRPGVNNGVGIRTPMGVDAAYDGMCEVQILDHDDPIYAGWLKEYQVHGSVYGVIPAKRIVHKPLGEWSTEEIRVQGNHITVTVNGEVIVDGDVKEACQGHNVAPAGYDSNPFTVDHKDHPGMFNEQGHIGFLGHGAGVKFRNVRVLDLSPAKIKK